MRRKILAVLAVAVTLVAVTASVSQASIPGTDGVVHGCYKTADLNEGNMYVIDSAASCPSGFTTLDWAQGIPGAWQTPTLGAGCISVDNDSDGVTETIKYRLEGDVVRIKGIVSGCSSGGASVIFTLPTGYRPSEFRTPAYNVTVNRLGNVVVPGCGTCTWFLDGSFPVS